MTEDDDAFELNEAEFIGDYGRKFQEGVETKALLIGMYAHSKDLPICEEHLSELNELSNTFGVETVGKMACSLKKIDASTYLHQGKLEEVLEAIHQKKANLVIFDEEITPAQQRNLEKLLKVPVMDRTELILEIFAQRAHTKEAQLQVELAKAKYQFPRLKRMWSHFSRQRASGGYLRGEGEKQIEIDRRLLRKQVDKLREEIREVERYRNVQRTSRIRSGMPTFAIIGYTNAGKSTLLNAMTAADVLVEDKLFATLDPTTRKFTLPNNQEILLTDTVGFIRKLPHTLVAAFKSTLEAAVHDDILLHLIDVSHPLAEEHAATTYEILKELKADERSVINVLNKVDKCEDLKMVYRLKLRYPKTVVISALAHTGFDELMEMMMTALKERRQLMKLKIPQSAYALVTQLRREGNVLSEEYEENDVLLAVEVPLESVHRYLSYSDAEALPTKVNLE